MVVAHELAHGLGGGGHPKISEEIWLAETNSQFVIDWTLSVEGYNIEPGCTVRIVIPSLSIYQRDTIAQGTLSHWDELPDNRCRIYLQEPIRFEPNNGHRNYYQANDVCEIISNSIMGHTQAPAPEFCAAWLSKIRGNADTPLP